MPESLAWPESLDRAGRRAAYIFADDLFLLDLAASRFERLTRTGAKESLPRLSPDGRKLAFVRGNDLFVLDLASRAESRLTSDGSDTVLNGALSWVYWEEVFDHADAGYWWSEDGSAIAFLRTDESAVSQWASRTSGHRRRASSPSATRRPAAPTRRCGSASWTSAAGRRSGWTPRRPPTSMWWRVEWPPDNRARRRADREPRCRLASTSTSWTATSGKPTRVLTETDAGWVNMHDLEFLEGGKGFLWSSERDGYTHLYRYATDGTLREPGDEGPVVGARPRRLHTAPLGRSPRSTRRAGSSTSPPSRNRRSSGTSTASVSTARARSGSRARTASTG